MNGVRVVIVFFALGIFPFACESSVRDERSGIPMPASSSGENTSIGGGGAGGDLGFGGGGFGFGGFEPVMHDPCPEVEPIPDAPCSHLNMKCEYGDDPRPECRKRFGCLAAGPDPLFWLQLAPDKPCDPLDSSACPIEPLDSTTCNSASSLCIYSDGRQCACFGTWSCVQPPDPPCPPIAPNYGFSCPMEGLVCKYGDCAFGTAMVRYCSGGVWFRQLPECGPWPLSSCEFQ